MATVPRFVSYYSVDEVIECLPINKDTAEELLEVCPDAYGGPVPGELEGDNALKYYWGKLSKESQEDIIRAWTLNSQF